MKIIIQLIVACTFALSIHAAEVPDNAEKTNPLGVGDSLPTSTVLSIDGKVTTLGDYLDDDPLLLVFYRGGWCMFCNQHLADLGQNQELLEDEGVVLIGISPDKPEELKKTAEKLNLDYILLSDSSMELGRSFGLAFELDEETRNLYKTYDIDLEAASGQTHYQLPVPAVFLVSPNGKIFYANSNPDYKVRPKTVDILAAIKAYNQQ